MKFFIDSKISEHISTTPDGFLLCQDVPITRVGELEYADGEIPIEADDAGRIVVSRTAEDIFDEKTLASFNGKSVTIQHPEDFVNPENWKELTVGIVQNARKGAGQFSDFLLADLLITDSRGITLVKNGLREVSCGYEAEYLQTGDGKGKQSNIRGNHVALVTKGRAGETCAIHDNHKGVFMSKLKQFKDKVMKTFDEAAAELEAEKATEDNGAEGIAKAITDALAPVMSRLDKLEGSKKETPAAKEVAEEDKAEDEGEVETAATQADENERLTNLENGVAKILEILSSTSDTDVEEVAEEEIGDADVTGVVTSDSLILSRAEIIAPGIANTKDIKVQALKKAYSTSDGKQVIEMLNGGKAPTFDNAANVDMLFVAVAELTKQERNGQVAETKKGHSVTTDTSGAQIGMTADKMNEINAAYYEKK